MSIQADIERGIQIRAQRKKLDGELKDIEARLENFGLKHPEDHVELVDAEREGRRWLARGSEHIVPVIFTADKVVSSFKANSPQHIKIINALGGEAFKIGKFYRREVKFESVFDNGKKFRKEAGEIFGDRAPLFITACVARDKNGIPKSDVKFLWDDAEKKEGA